jgi:hypothetical protein
LAFAVTLTIFPLSILMFIYTSIANEMNQQINDNNQLAINIRSKLNTIAPPSQDKVPQGTSLSVGDSEILREVIVELQKFATTAQGLFRRANQLNLYLFNLIPINDAEPVELPVPLEQTYDAISKARDNQIYYYQKIRAYSKDVLDGIL